MMRWVVALGCALALAACGRPSEQAAVAPPQPAAEAPTLQAAAEAAPRPLRPEPKAKEGMVVEEDRAVVEPAEAADQVAEDAAAVGLTTVADTSADAGE
jgi:hypothetical protein